MDPVLLARWQFGMTTVYHFFFVPLTMGLSIAVAIMQTLWVTSGQEVYKRMTKFWGKLFLINYVMGVVTGIVLEFQFGMNWSEYSRFVGDVFGVPLAIEALVAFFLESTFLGVWIFGWDKLPKKVHAATIWLVALGANVSAVWILIANSFMQQPVGHVLRNGRVEMESFWTLVTNPHVLVQFPHVFTAALATAAFFMMGVSAYHLLRSEDEVNRGVFRRSMRFGVIYGLIGTVAVIVVGHSQAQYMIQIQPMKMAAAEALWETADPAPMSLLTIGHEPERRDRFALKVPGLLSFLAYNRFSGEVKGVKNLQEEYERVYGAGDYVPPVMWTYWTFRIMAGAGFVMLALAACGLYLVLEDKLESAARYLALFPPAIVLPYLANSTGWIFTEIGRQPWIVFGLQKTADAVSPNVTAGQVLLTLVCFTLLYGVLMTADAYLLARFARAGAADSEEDRQDGSTVTVGV